MKTRCVQCQTLCDVAESYCPACNTPLVATRGVDESPRWNGKVRSQWRSETTVHDAKDWRDKLNDWLELDSSQVMLLIIGIATISVITLLIIFFVAAIGIA